MPAIGWADSGHQPLSALFGGQTRVLNTSPMASICLPVKTDWGDKRGHFPSARSSWDKAGHQINPFDRYEIPCASFILFIHRWYTMFATLKKGAMAPFHIINFFIFYFEPLHCWAISNFLNAIALSSHLENSSTIPGAAYLGLDSHTKTRCVMQWYSPPLRYGLVCSLSSRSIGVWLP